MQKDPDSLAGISSQKVPEWKVLRKILAWDWRATTSHSRQRWLDKPMIILHIMLLSKFMLSAGLRPSRTPRLMKQRRGGFRSYPGLHNHAKPWGGVGGAFFNGASSLYTWITPAAHTNLGQVCRGKGRLIHLKTTPLSSEVPSHSDAEALGARWGAGNNKHYQETNPITCVQTFQDQDHAN